MPIVEALRYFDFYEALFQFSEEKPPIIEQLYLYLKRFRTQPSEFYAMDKDDRLEIYHREFKIVKEEYEKMKKLENKA